MKVITTLFNYLLIAGLLLLAFKPFIFHSTKPAPTQSTQFTTQNECPNRLLSAAACTSSSYFTVKEEEIFDFLTIFLVLTGLIFFKLNDRFTSSPITRILRPPILTL